MAKYTLRQMCENWRILIGREGRTNLVAEDGGRIAGFASFAAASPGDGGPEAVAELMGMYVHPDFWGGGHAAKLFAAALEHMRAASFAEAVLWTWQANHRGRRFYEKMGFTKDASVLRDRFGQPLVEVRYRGVVATQG
jgi:GNAT superfamily N-acetyltransferase